MTLRFEDVDNTHLVINKYNLFAQGLASSKSVGFVGVTSDCEDMTTVLHIQDGSHVRLQP